MCWSWNLISAFRRVVCSATMKVRFILHYQSVLWFHLGCLVTETSSSLPCNSFFFLFMLFIVTAWIKEGTLLKCKLIWINYFSLSVFEYGWLRWIKHSSMFWTFWWWLCGRHWKILSLFYQWSDKLQKLDFQELVLFLQNLPTQNWTYLELEMVLSRAFMWYSMFNASPSHLASWASICDFCIFVIYYCIGVIFLASCSVFCRLTNWLTNFYLWRPVL